MKNFVISSWAGKFVRYQKIFVCLIFVPLVALYGRKIRTFELAGIVGTKRLSKPLIGLMKLNITDKTGESIQIHWQT